MRFLKKSLGKVNNLLGNFWEVLVLKMVNKNMNKISKIKMVKNKNKKLRNNSENEEIFWSNDYVVYILKSIF